MLFKSSFYPKTCRSKHVKHKLMLLYFTFIIGKRMIESPASEMLDITRREIAATVQRCCTTLGNTSDARYWREFRRNIGRDQLLGDMLLGKIRASLQVELPSTPLTRQELTCLRLSANGQTSADIGLKLGIKPRTVNFHFSKILRKLNAANRQEAIAKASNANLLRTP